MTRPTKTKCPLVDRKTLVDCIVCGIRDGLRDLEKQTFTDARLYAEQNKGLRRTIGVLEQENDRLQKELVIARNWEAKLKERFL